jgi:DNA-binding MarR family transcriptional regulator
MNSLFGIVPLVLVKDKRIGLNDLRVYVALTSFAGLKQKCWPGVSKIAERSGVHPSHVPKHTKKLADLGYIEKVRRGKGISNVYYIVDHGPVKQARGKGLVGPALSDNAQSAVGEIAGLARSNKKNNSENIIEENNKENNREENRRTVEQIVQRIVNRSR